MQSSPAEPPSQDHPTGTAGEAHVHADHGPSRAARGAHDHSHGDGHDHSLPQGPQAAKRMLLAMALTGGFLIAEVVGGVLSGSLALLADAGHMVTDVAALLLGYIGLTVGQRKADPRRSFGYQRFEVLASFVNGIALLALSAWIIVEAGLRLSSPIEVLSGPMLVIAVLGLAVNVASYFMLRSGGDNINVQGALIHVLGDLLGSVATIIAAAVIWMTGWMPIDPLLSVLVALLIIRSGWDITRRTAHVLLEGTPEGLDLDEIKRDLGTLPMIAEVFHIHVWSLTTGKLLATLNVRPQQGYDIGAVTAAVRERLQVGFGIEHATIEVDTAPAGAAAGKPASLP